MIKNILFAFVFLFQFHIVGSYETLAQSDSVFDDSDLADIEGLDGRDEDSELEDEFGDLSDETIIDNFSADDFEQVEDSAPEDTTDPKDIEDEIGLEDDFDKDDYEELSDRPGYEVITDEELEKEFLEGDDDESSEDEDSLDSESLNEEMESTKEDLETESAEKDSESKSTDISDGPEEEEEEEEEEEPKDSEDMEIVDESADSKGMELVDESADSTEGEDERAKDLLEEDSTDEEGKIVEDLPEEDFINEDSDMEQLKEDIENMEEQEEELEGLKQEIEQTNEKEEQLKSEEAQIQIEQEKEEQNWNKKEEESLGLEEPAPFEEPVVEGLPVEEETPSLSGLNLITNIRYLTEKDQIVIDTSEIASYQERSNSETNQLVIEVLQSQLGENLHWPYILRDFNTDFGLIKADQKDSSTVRVIIQLKEGADFPKTTLSQEGNQIIIGYGEVVNNEIVPLDQAQSAGSDFDSILPSKTLEELYFGKIEFSGTPVSFHVIDAPIKQVLRFISEESGLNMVIDESVSGTVTLKLEDVPWDQALHTIFKVKSLGYTRDGNVITILPLSKIEERTRKLKEISERQKSLSPFHTKVIPIMFAKAVDVEKKVKEFSTVSQGNLRKGGRIIVHEESNTLVVVDTVETIKKIEAMAKFLDKPPQQVMVESKIVEVTKSFAKDFGFSWSLGGNFPVEIGPGGPLEFAKNAFGNMTSSYDLSYEKGTRSNITISGIPFIGDVDATLNLAEQNGSAQVLSTAKVLTKSGQSASITKNTPILILASRNTALDAGATGTETAGAINNNTAGNVGGVVQETTQTQDITLSLQVTPIVTSSGSIAIQTNLNLSTPGGEGGAFKTDRTATTEVLTKSGQTVVISGIYQKNETETGDMLPWLGKIPFLGWIFKNRNTNFAESEMLMFLTPTLISQ